MLINMVWLINTLLFLGAFILMEGVAWFTHKYIMHGFMWRWHRSHHRVHPHPLERNDLFALVFSIPSIALIMIGYNAPNVSWLKFIGFGILAYGIFYFIFHDVIVHRRIKIPFKAKSKYLKRIIRAHYVHHETHSKEGAKAFGFLYAPKKYEKEKVKA
tara:strand:+ start:648 stop:1121 length:474 start_codon:yes stop_codon:yes gene_type:complete